MWDKNCNHSFVQIMKKLLLKACVYDLGEDDDDCRSLMEKIDQYDVKVIEEIMIVMNLGVEGKWGMKMKTYFCTNFKMKNNFIIQIENESKFHADDKVAEYM